MADILTVKRMLADRTQSVAEYLLPNGRREGQEWRAGSTGGEKGQSLGVHLTGAKAGIWADFESGESGDLLDLWCAARARTISEALDEARTWLGVSRPQPYREPKRSYVRPPKPQCRPAEGQVLDYLTGTRKLPADVLKRYRVAAKGSDIVFPFLLPDGTLALAKARKAEDGAKPVPTAKDCEPILFGWQAIPDNARECVIAEGEIDALSWAAYGWPAFSVPFGGGGGAKQQWIENEFDRLERFERIYVAADMDQAGDEAAAEIASRLGRHRCLRVRLPRKDANQCLQEGVSREEIDRCIRDAESLDPDGLRRASDFADKVIHLFWPAEGEHVGYSTPYGKIGNKLLFRPAEVTLWSGATGSGKSQILSDCTVHWVSERSRICLSSLEMQAAQTLKRMCKQVVGTDRPTAQAIQGALEWLDQGLLLYEFVGKANVDTLLEVFDYARGKYGCDQFVIDSLMRLGVASDDYVGQEKAVFRLVDWAIANNVHLHLVAHSRKGGQNKAVQETEDVKGAMEIGANAFNILIVWRNRDQEERMHKASEDERAEVNKVPGVVLNVTKQRNGDFEGKVGLWFDQSCYRYYSSHDRNGWGRNYLPRQEQAA